MTTIRLHDSMARQKRDFSPIDEKNVRMYVCGPTVYDRAHIGNARPVVVFDVLFRLLRHVYGAKHVTYVRNITDIEDKIIARAAENGEAIGELTARTAKWFRDDMAALGCLPPTHQPRATEHVPGMIAMIEALVAQGKAYAAEGHVLFEVGGFADYGRLSGRSTEDMIAGARVEIAPYKRDPMDFVLWKPSTPDQPGWESPWGRGRPGWHIECSAMARALLGAEFDIHGGGADLMFPHHENEVAQSVCAHPGEGFARYWLHNGMVRVEGRKMSKSLGNFLTMEDLRAQAPGEVLRLALLMTHYRDPLDWTAQRLEEAAATLRRWRALPTDEPAAASAGARVISALADDLNTPRAIAALHVIAASGDGATLRAAAAPLGLLGDELGDWAAAPEAGDDGWRIDALLKARAEARAAKDFSRADAIRKGLDAAGVVVMDRPDGPSEWSLTPEFDAAKLAELRA
ncbi:cysteine--tRNA ligase [Rubrimonas cliftonensis]|uniref:Cysteine--tRNA ligase n=1 Tax=Rubrimonas cliftonensis TaxID=89524 RepID=A0A1H3VRQ6_9RHOB|nr:cysteine--tRNA ligase [Rubrimonas cliftonensis]SDZ77361.1 cysteinyl-tRNA synthetase [Rubrimonas cliftonensis]